MTPKERAAMQKALEALREYRDTQMISAPRKAIESLREALAEKAEQEPNYFGLTHDHTWLSIDKKQYDKLKPEGRMACYAAPVRTKDLTDDEVMQTHTNFDFDSLGEQSFILAFARAVIAADRSKNK